MKNIMFIHLSTIAACFGAMAALAANFVGWFNRDVVYRERRLVEEAQAMLAAEIEFRRMSQRLFERQLGLRAGESELLAGTGDLDRIRRLLVTSSDPDLRTVSTAYFVVNGRFQVLSDGQYVRSLFGLSLSQSEDPAIFPHAYRSSNVCRVVRNQDEYPNIRAIIQSSLFFGAVRMNSGIYVRELVDLEDYCLNEARGGRYEFLVSSTRRMHALDGRPLTLAPTLRAEMRPGRE